MFFVFQNRKGLRVERDGEGSHPEYSLSYFKYIIIQMRTQSSNAANSQLCASEKIYYWF